MASCREGKREADWKGKEVRENIPCSLLFANGSFWTSAKMVHFLEKKKVGQKARKGIACTRHLDQVPPLPTAQHISYLPLFYHSLIHFHTPLMTHLQWWAVLHLLMCDGPPSLCNLSAGTPALHQFTCSQSRFYEWYKAGSIA